MSSTDTYIWWRNALAGKVGPIHDGVPQAGFYRRRRSKQDPTWVPAAIWPDANGEMVAVCDGRPVDAIDLWTWVAKHPVTEEAYRAAERGEPWPDDAPRAPAPGIGHNAPDDPAEAIREELAGEAEMAAAFLSTPIESQDAADKAAVWARKIGDIAKRADEARKVEKEPHLRAGREIDAKWSAVIERAKELSAALKRHVEPFLIAKRREEEAKRKAAEEEARRLREAAAKQQDEEARAEALRQAQAAEAAAKDKGTNAGRTGAKVALRSEKRARIVDYEAALMALKDHAEVKALVEQLANRAVRAGVSLAGVEVETFERAA